MNITQSTQIGLKQFSHTHTNANKNWKSKFIWSGRKTLETRNSPNEKHTLQEISDRNNLR